MPNHAQATLVGHLGQNPELRVSQSGTEICNFSIATSTGRDKNEKTTWWNVIAFKGTAKVASEYLKKGDPVMIIGEPYLDQWEDKDGAKRQTLKITANQIVFLTSKGSSDKDAGRDDEGHARAAAKPVNNDHPFDDEIPF